MTDTQLTAVITGICTAIPLLGAQLLAWNARKRQSQEIVAKVDTVIAKADEIHVLADGNLSRVTNELKAANTRIDMMETMLRSLNDAKVVADRLADKASDIAAGELDMKKQSQKIELPTVHKEKTKP